MAAKHLAFAVVLLAATASAEFVAEYSGFEADSQQHR